MRTLLHGKTLLLLGLVLLLAGCGHRGRSVAELRDRLKSDVPRTRRAAERKTDNCEK